MDKLNPSDYPRRVSEDFEAQHRTRSRFHSAVILLDDVVQIRTSSHLDPTPHSGLTTKLKECAMARSMPIERQSHRGASGRERFPKEILGRIKVAMLAQPEVNRPAALVHSPIKVTPLPFDANVSLVDTPGLPYGTGEPHPALLELWYESL